MGMNSAPKPSPIIATLYFLAMGADPRGLFTLSAHVALSGDRSRFPGSATRALNGSRWADSASNDPDLQRINVKGSANSSLKRFFSRRIDSDHRSISYFARPF